MIKVLGIGGSPRRGNSDLLLDRALEGAADSGAATEKVVLSRLQISPCQECGNCNKTGRCRIEDDMQALHRKLVEADGLILVSPIFFMGLSAQTKAMIDRCQALWARKHLLGLPIAEHGRRRLGLFISVGATNRPYTFRPSITVVKAFFATLEVTYRGELVYGDIDRRGDIRKHPTALAEAYEAGAGLARALVARDGGMAIAEAEFERKVGASRPEGRQKQ